MRFIDYPAIVVVWTQDGCPACEEFLPRWRPVAQQYQGCLPSVAVNCTEYKMAADYYRISDTPTVMVLRYGRASWRKLHGAVTPDEIAAFYQYAAMGLDCQIG